MDNEITVFKEQSNISIYNVEITDILNKFIGKLNKEPNPNEIKKNKFADNTDYIPISFLEMQLDEFFFGLWQTDNFKFQTIANELIGSIDLKVFHPIAKQWITRSGVGAVLIRQKKDSDITDISAKIKNALAMDAPHLKAMCFRNAVASLGKLFGRDLNRAQIDIGLNPVWDGVQKITKMQAKQMNIVRLENKMSIDTLIEIIKEYGFNSSEEITKDLFNTIIDRIKENGKYNI